MRYLEAARVHRRTGQKLSAFPVVLTTEQVHVAPVFPQGGAGGKVGAALVLRSAVVRHRLSFHAAPYRITMSVKIRYILYFRHKNIPFLQQRRQAVPPVFSVFFPISVIERHPLHTRYGRFFIPGRGGVDLGHVKAGGAIQAIVAEVKERGFRIRACLPAVTYSRGRPICVLVRVLTSTKQRTLLSQAIRSISPKRQR